MGRSGGGISSFAYSHLHRERRGDAGRERPFMDAFNQLGTRIARAWSTHGYETAALPDIAGTELVRASLHQVIDYRSLLSWICATDTLPYQMNVDATFGEPPLTLFWHPDFYVEALFWASSTTSVHGHSFVGAFQVLAGTSLQSLFAFDACDPRKGPCRIGRLRQTHAALLRTGATQLIQPGERFIHSIFHLGYPSVTIVVRTHGRHVERQYDYHRPGVALAYGYENTFDQLTNRLLQVARLQAILKSDDLPTTVAAIGKRRNLAACFRLLRVVQPILYRQQRLETAGEVIAALAATVGLNETTKLAESLTLEQSLQRLRSARELVVDDDLRLFLALLLTQQEGQFVMRLVTDYTDAAKPTDKIASWIRELGTRGILNVPTDEQTQSLLATWLAYGPDAALRADPTPQYGSWAAAKMQQIEAEPLLTPMLRSDGSS
jgi:hypothetical protein